MILNNKKMKYGLLALGGVSAYLLAPELWAINMEHDTALKDAFDYVQKTNKGGVMPVVSGVGLTVGGVYSVVKSTPSPVILAAVAAIILNLGSKYLDSAYTVLI